MDNFDLSEKILKVSNPYFRDGQIDDLILMSKDVKEFIRLLKDDIMSASDLPTTISPQVEAFDFVLERIDKRAGEELAGK